MSLVKSFFNELKHESVNSRKILERVPEEHFGWRPHEKSMTLAKLAGHIAELTQWVPIILTGTAFNLLGPEMFKRAHPDNRAALLQVFDRHLSEALEVLGSTADDALQVSWTMRRGDFTVVQLPRKIALRHLTLNHIIHHRGQLSVYLRLLDVSVPGMYGPSADEG